MVMCLGCMIVNGFPIRECVENVINYFSWAGGNPYFKWSSVEFSEKFLELELFLI